MKMPDADVIPVLAIFVGGVLSVTTSVALFLDSDSSGHDRSEPVLVAPEAPRRAPTLSTDDRLSRSAVREEFAVLVLTQLQVARQVEQLSTEEGPERSAQLAALRDRKDQLHAEVVQLGRKLRSLAAAEHESGRPDVARVLRETLAALDESRLDEKIRYSQGTIQHWDKQSAATLELQIELDLRSVLGSLEGQPVS